MALSPDTFRSDPAQAETGFVYFIGPKDLQLDRIKIGFTASSPFARLASMQTGSPFEMRVWAYFAGSMELEALFHGTFAPVREHGEWFRLEGKLLALTSELWCETYAESPVPRGRLINILSGILPIDTPPMFYDEDKWFYSISEDNHDLQYWTHDEAWAAYQAERCQ